MIGRHGAPEGIRQVGYLELGTRRHPLYASFSEGGLPRNIRYGANLGVVDDFPRFARKWCNGDNGTGDGGEMRITVAERFVNSFKLLLEVENLQGVTVERFLPQSK